MLNKVLKILLIIGILLAIVFVIASLFASKSAIKATVESVSPFPNTTTTTLYPDIKVNFSRPLTKEEQSEVSALISPFIKFHFEWLENGKSLRVVGDEHLSGSRNYVVQINFLDIKYSWSFRTIPEENAPDADLEKIQGESDAYFNQQATLFLNKYPWYNKIPESKSFFIGFDSEKNLFNVALYPDSKLETPVEAQVENLKNQIQSSLKSIGIDLSRYKFEWHVFPK